MLRLLSETYRVRMGGPAVIERRRRARLAEMVVFARTRSPYYRRLYRGLPDRVDDPTRLPVTSKVELMAHFDDAVTDPAVTHEKVRAWGDDPNLAGERFLGAYLVATTSGSSGTRGLFVMDDRTAAAATAFSVAMMMAFLDTGDILRIVASGGRAALIVATGGHFVGFAGVSRVRRARPRLARALLLLPADTPLPEMVAQLNRSRPAMLGGYAGIIDLLTGEQQAGRLDIHPVFIHPSSEGLGDQKYDRMERVFQAKVRTAYVATECMPGLAQGCRHRWLHLTSDWCILEPVDSDYRPVPAGVQSHTVLLSNLANRVQPILRYDLGDSVLVRPDPCPCGNPMPAIRVQGRVADALTFPTPSGDQIVIAPLVLVTLVDRIAGIEQCQIIQTAPAVLRVRLRPAATADRDRVWQEVHSGIAQLLQEQGLAHVEVERAGELPKQSAGGKYREVIPLRLEGGLRATDRR